MPRLTYACALGLLKGEGMRYWFVLGFLLVTTSAYAQCVATVRDVRLDEERGSIIVETEYQLDGKVVEVGHTMYLELNGTQSEIVDLVKKDIAEHCENLIIRIPSNLEFIQKEIVNTDKVS